MARPRASYAYPRVWDHVEDLGYFASERGLLKAKAEAQINGKEFSLGNRTIETKFNPYVPALFDHDVAHNVVQVINWHRSASGKPTVIANQEIVRFDHRITGPGFTSDRVDISNLSAIAGYPLFVLEAALLGRLLPRRVCEELWMGCSGVGLDPSRLRVEPVVGNAKKLFRPFADPDKLRDLFQVISKW